MEDQSIEYIEITGLGIYIDPLFARIIFDEVMELYPDRKNLGARKVKQAIKATVRIPGFRDGMADKAPVQQLRNHLENTWFQIPPLAEAVMDLWYSTQDEMLRICDAWLESQKSTLKAFRTGVTGEENESIENMSIQEYCHKLTHEFMEQHPEYEFMDHVELCMLMSLAKHVEGEEAPLDEDTSESEVLPVWNETLQKIEQIPADDSCWQSAEEFIQAVQAMVARKIEEHEKSKQTVVLQQALDENKALFKKWSQYFEVENVHNWSVEHLAVTEYDTILEKISQLAELLGAFEEVDQRKPATLAERKQLDKDRSEAEGKIVGLYQNLTSELITVEKHVQPVQEQPTSENEPITPEHTKGDVDSGPSGVVEKIDTGATTEQNQEENLKAGTSQVEDGKDTTQSGPSNEEAGFESGEATMPDLGSGDMVSPVNRLLFDHLSNNDLSKAYWLTWGIEQENEPASIPSWLIAAVQGVTWQIGLWPDQPGEFLESLHSFILPNQQSVDYQNPAQVNLIAAAGMFMSLVAPGRGWEELWHPIQSFRPASLGFFVNEVKEANRKGLRLDPNLVQLVVNKEQMEQRTTKYSQDAQDWQQKSKTRGASLFRAQQVWQELVHSQRGELYKLMEPVAKDQREKAKDIEETSKRWRNRNWLEKTIQKIDQDLTKNKKKRPIVGEPREQIFSWVWDACDIAENWAKSIQDWNESKEKGKNWLYEQTKEFCDSASQLLEKVIEELREETEILIDKGSYASQQLLLLILKGIKAILTPKVMIDPVEFPKPPLYTDPLERWEKKNYERNLVVALLLYPELQLNEHGYPSPEKSTLVVEILSNDAPRSIEESLDGWIQAHDYRFIDFLLSKTKDRELWETRVQESFRSDVHRLEVDYLEDTITGVEQALLDGLISETEHTDYKSQIESIRKLTLQTNYSELQFISLSRMYTKLELINKQLKEKREERLSSLLDHWNEIKEQLPRLTHTDQDLMSEIIHVVEGALNNKDLRVSGEYLSHLDGVFAGTQDLSKSIFELTSMDEKDVLAEFNTMMPVLTNVLEKARSGFSLNQVRDAIVNDRPISNFTFPPNFPGQRRREAAKAIEAWRLLKSSGADIDSRGNLSLTTQVQSIMEYLGFTFSIPNPVTVLEMPDSSSNFIHWRVSAFAGDFSPVAQFGSQRNGRFDFIGVWERPGIDIISSQISSLMKRTGNQPTILLYFGRLVLGQRKELLSITHRDNLPMVVIDELLILYLTRQFGTRLKPTFLCTLPYAALNPYFPAAAGLIPPEVFKGRQDLVEKLIDFYGQAIVYGGRQLGKSALLRMAQRQFHRPQNNHYAIYEDIRSVGDSMSEKNYQVDLFERIIQAFNKAKFPVSLKVSPDFDRLLNNIQQVLVEKDLKVILLLDEADHFLDADAEKNFYLVQKLKNLMDASNRHFKLVIAGLHNVQRFQRMSNQPLAHLGTPIEIGPLEPEAACELLMDPMHAIGYYFGDVEKEEDISLVLHILSYTNYHPGLIQLFGNYLVEHLRNKYQKPALPPLPIRRADIEAVYRKKDVRDAIRDRFNWTLALDPRYEAIMLALILEQWEDQNGFDRRYTARELREIASSWWSGAFDNESTFKGFLDELRGLGVLSTVDEGSKYRLRSPNLVHLMGTRDEIDGRMEAIISSQPPGEHALESSRARLDTGSYSPFTFAQEQVLNTPRSGVVIIFGTPAAGLQLIDQALQRIMPEKGVFCEIRIAAQNGAAIKQQLDRFVSEQPQARTLIALREAAGFANELLDQVKAALKYCRTFRGRVLKVFFTLDAQTTWQWFELPRNVRLEIEDQVEVVLPLTRWDRIGIKQRIEKQLWSDVEVQLTEPLLRKVLDATNGWHNLLEELFSRHFDGRNPLRSVEEFSKAVESTDNPLERTFINDIGIIDEIPRKMIQALRQVETDDVDLEKLDNTLEYLKRLNIVTADDNLDPLITRLLKNA